MRALYWFSFFALLPSSLSCGKPDPVYHIHLTGIVRDSKTGMPLKDARVSMYQFEYYDKTHTNSVEKFDYTDSLGRFSLSLTGYGFSLFEVSRPGYLTRQSIHPTEVDEEQFFDIKLIAKDGILKLKIENSLVEHDSIYVMITNPSNIKEYIASGYTNKVGSFIDKAPLVLPYLGIYEVVSNHASEEYTRIDWGYSLFKDGNGALFYDSIYLLPHDTLEYSISF